MGQTISSAADMISYAGELRRAARREPQPEVAQKLVQSAARLEKNGIAEVAKSTAPHLGRLLDSLV